MINLATKHKQLSTNRQIADIPLRMKARNVRREKLLILMPEHNWNYTKAGIAAGYSKYYATHRLPTILSKDVTFCSTVDKLKADIKLQTDFKAADIKRELWILYRDPATNATTKARCLELLGKSIAMYVDRGITEDATQARQLSEQEQQEAKRLAILLMNERNKKQTAGKQA